MARLAFGYSGTVNPPVFDYLVRPGESIQDAIDQAEANLANIENPTVAVSPGFFEEDLTLAGLAGTFTLYFLPLEGYQGVSPNLAGNISIADNTGFGIIRIENMVQVTTAVGVPALSMVDTGGFRSLRLVNSNLAPSDDEDGVVISGGSAISAVVTDSFIATGGTGDPFTMSIVGTCEVVNSVISSNGGSADPANALVHVLSGAIDITNSKLLHSTGNNTAKPVLRQATAGACAIRGCVVRGGDSNAGSIVDFANTGAANTLTFENNSVSNQGTAYTTGTGFDLIAPATDAAVSQGGNSFLDGTGSKVSASVVVTNGGSTIT